MSIYDELPFVDVIGRYLDKFERRSDMLWNFRCPICGDSQRNKNKARGYIYENRGRLSYKCHNCNIGMSFGKLLKEILPSEYPAYRLACFREKQSEEKRKRDRIPEKIVFRKLKARIKLQHIPNNLAVDIADLDDDHPAATYLQERLLTPKMCRRLKYTTDFRSLVQNFLVEELCGKYDHLPSNDHRIVLPCYSLNGDITGLQGRSVGISSQRYITTQVRSDIPRSIFGFDTWLSKEFTYFVEGPIDSLFLPNSLAAMSSDLAGAARCVVGMASVEKEQFTLVFDNEPRNHEIVRLMDMAIDDGWRICIWPELLVGKDINDMITSGSSADDIVKCIESRKFSGLRAKLELKKWAKVQV